MSLNSLVDRSHVVEVAALQSILKRQLQLWRGASTLEDKLLIEAETISRFEELIEGNLEIAEVEMGDHPELMDWMDFVSTSETLAQSNAARLNRMSEIYLRYYNNEKMLLLNLIGKLRRIKQKQATLSLWDREKSLYVLFENFSTLDNLSSEFNSAPECTVDLVQGVLLLPSRGIVELPVQTIKITEGSNGQPGNSDVDIQTNNNQLEFMLNQSTSDWFEYERMDSGPCILSIYVDFGQEQIVNQIAIEPINLGNSLSFAVEDITFIGMDSGSTSIWDVVSERLPEETFVVKPVGNDTYWRLNTLPVKAKSMILRLQQNHGYPIRVLTQDGREVLRQRFAIAIKNMRLSRVEYEQAGGIGSSKLSLIPNLFAALPVVEAFGGKTLWKGVLSVSSDSGNTWSGNLISGGSELPSTYLMDGTDRFFAWRLFLERNDSAFSGLSSIVRPTKKTYSSVLRTVSRLQSPVEISLPDRPMDGEVIVVQPKVLRRGDRYTSYRLGEAMGTRASYHLPFNLLHWGIDPDSVRLFVNNRLWDRVSDESELGLGVWTFSSDYRSVVINESAPKGSILRLSLDEERAHFEERADGYYHQMKMMFDPDPDSISIEAQQRGQKRKSFLLPGNRTVISLGVKGIRGDFVLVSDLGTVFTEVDDKLDLLDAEDDEYFIDSENGILHLARKLGEENVRAVFSYIETVVIPQKSIEVVYENGSPWGIRVNKDVVPATEHTDVVGEAVRSRINILNNRYEDKDDPYGLSAVRRKALSHDFIMKSSVRVSGIFDSTLTPQEVPYIDGKTEFFDLVEMTNEKTVETEETSNIVEFTLSAGAAVYEPLGVVFSNSTIFETHVSPAGAVNAPGEYNVNYTTGMVTVFILTGESLPGGIQISYHYRRPSSDEALKYSVDYEDGILYSGSDLLAGGTIKYKTAPAKISYDVALPVAFTYSATENSISVKTEFLNESSGLIKAIWSKKAEEGNVEELRRYFSPMISSVGFRFN